MALEEQYTLANSKLGEVVLNNFENQATSACYVGALHNVDSRIQKICGPLVMYYQSGLLIKMSVPAYDLKRVEQQLLMQARSAFRSALLRVDRMFFSPLVEAAMHQEHAHRS